MADHSELEEENARLRAALADRDALLGMIEGSLDGIWDWEIPTGRDYLSPRWKRMLGYTEDELPDTVETWKNLLVPEDVAKGYAAVQAHWDHGAPYEIVLRYRRKDGSIAHMLARGEAIRDEAGAWVRMAGTHTDITALVEAQAEIRQLNEGLEARVQRRTAELEAFAHSISHDLRAPLRAMDGYSLVLLEDHAEALAPDATHALGRIRLGVSRMSAIIDALLALSRVSRAELLREAVDLSALAERMVVEYREAHPTAQVSVEVEAGLVFDCDRQLVSLAIENLLSNSIKFAAGVDRPEVRFELHAPGVLCVRDNGVGFDMRYQDKLFQPFARLHHDSHAGTGVGLAIVHRVVQRHGGRIWATGEVGAGACFFVTFDPNTPHRDGS